MKRFIIITLSSFIIMAMGCQKDKDNQPPNDYQGIWSGTYSGSADNGFWTVNVREDLSVVGTVTSNVFNESYVIDGMVDLSGNLVATYGTASNGGEFNGQLTGTLASGRWKNTQYGFTGDWSGSRQ